MICQPSFSVPSPAQQASSSGHQGLSLGNEDHSFANRCSTVVSS
jgi:hypothetical protein